MSTVMEVSPRVWQRLEALEKANWVRSSRSELKREIKGGRRLLADVLAAPPEYAEKMSVLELLLAVPRVGRVKAMRWLRQASISPSATLGALSGRQRAELVARLGGPR